MATSFYLLWTLDIKPIHCLQTTRYTSFPAWTRSWAGSVCPSRTLSSTTLPGTLLVSGPLKNSATDKIVQIFAINWPWKVTIRLCSQECLLPWKLWNCKTWGRFRGGIWKDITQSWSRRIEGDGSWAPLTHGYRVTIVWHDCCQRDWQIENIVVVESIWKTWVKNQDRLHTQNLIMFKMTTCSTLGLEWVTVPYSQFFFKLLSWVARRRKFNFFPAVSVFKMMTRSTSGLE